MTRKKSVKLSKKNKESFLSVFPQFTDKTSVIWNPIPTDKIKTLSEAKIGFDVLMRSKTLNLITISRLDPNKGLERIVHMASNLNLAGYKFYWYVVGGGPYKSEFENLLIARDVCNVILTGALDNPYPLLKACDLFVLPSQYEGMPVTIHEALILNVPVLASDVGGVSEQLEGNRGILAKNNEDSLYEALRGVFENPDSLKYLKEKNKNYCYNNDQIFNQLRELLA